VLEHEHGEGDVELPRTADRELLQGLLVALVDLHVRVDALARVEPHQPAGAVPDTLQLAGSVRAGADVQGRGAGRHRP
jgi:hypothetical protein